MKHILEKSVVGTYFHMFISLVTMFAVFFISRVYVSNDITIIGWIIDAVITGVISLLLVGITGFVLYREDFRFMCDKLLKVFRKKLGK